MRVAIKYDERSRGLIFKRTDIFQTFVVEFTDEEKATIRERQSTDVELENMSRSFLVSPHMPLFPLWEKIPILNLFIRRNPYCITIGQLLLHQTFVYKWDTPSNAKRYEEGVRESLQYVKDYLARNKDVSHDDFYDLR